MVQDMIDRLAEIESRQIFLKEQLRQAIDAAKITIDMISECDNDIFELRSDIELRVNNN